MFLCVQFIGILNLIFSSQADKAGPELGTAQPQLVSLFLYLSAALPIPVILGWLGMDDRITLPLIMDASFKKCWKIVLMPLLVCEKTQ